MRYVLEKEAPLPANLAALWTVDPALAERIEAMHPRPSYPVQRSKAGPPTVFVPTPDGRTVCLHSRYQPIEEARRLVDPIDVAERTTFYIFGFGLGYHLELLFERAGEEAIFCIFEPDLMVLRTAFEQRDFSRMIESRRAMFFTRLDKGDLLARRFDVPVGYSDHTTAALGGAMAVALGACVIERQLTYDRSAKGPDHAASSDPGQFERYVKLVREAETLRGAPGKTVLPIEQDVRKVSRQSLVARRTLKAGDTLRAEDLTVQRPGTGMPAAMFARAVGRRIAKPVSAGAILQWDMLSDAA